MAKPSFRSPGEAFTHEKLASFKGSLTKRNNPTGASRVRLAEEHKPEIRIAKRLYYQRMARKILTLISSIFIVCTVIYLCFAITIIRVIPTNNAGFIPVRNLTAAGGISKPGDQIVVNVLHSQGDGILDRTKQSLLMTSDAAIVQVMAGPFGKLSSVKGGGVAVNGKKIQGANLVHAPYTNYLNNEYIVMCLKGNCAKGMSFIVSANNVYGEPLNHQKVPTP